MVLEIALLVNFLVSRTTILVQYLHSYPFHHSPSNDCPVLSKKSLKEIQTTICQKSFYISSLEGATE